VDKTVEGWNKLGFWSRIGFVEKPVTHPPRWDLRYHDQPGQFDAELGWQRHGRVVYEWILPLKGPTVYSEIGTPLAGHSPERRCGRSRRSRAMDGRPSPVLPWGAAQLVFFLTTLTAVACFISPTAL
jgi:hypothetical protein